MYGRMHGIENRWVCIRAAEPTGSDMLVSGLRQVDAVPIDVCGRVRACGGARQPAWGGRIVVVRPSCSAAHAEPRCGGAEPCHVNSV
jgi:hypothetical protein